MLKDTRPAPVSKRNMSTSVLRSMMPKLLKVSPVSAVAVLKALPWSSTLYVKPFPVVIVARSSWVLLAPVYSPLLHWVRFSSLPSQAAPRIVPQLVGPVPPWPP